MRLSLPHRKQTKKRSDIALTKSVAHAIVASVRQGKPISKHAHRHLLLDQDEKSPPVSINTYLSWLRRGTKPVGSRRTLRDMVDEARRLREADEAVELLDVKKLQKIYDASPYFERVEVFKFGKSNSIEVTTSGIDYNRLQHKFDVAKRVWDKVEPLPKRPPRAKGLTLEKMRWHEYKSAVS